MFWGLGFSICASARGLPQNEVREASIKKLIEQIDQDRNDFKRTTQNAPEPSQAEGTFKAAQIDQVLDRYRNDLHITQMHHEMISGYWQQCNSALSTLPELSPFLQRLRNAKQRVDDSSSAENAAGLELISRLESLQRAYRNQDARTYNSLSDDLPSLYDKADGASKRTLAAAKDELQIMDDAESFLQQLLTSLEAEDARARETRTPAWVGEVRQYLNDHRGNIPLPFLVGWIMTESNGNFGAPATRLNERGYFQIHPDEWCYLRSGAEKSHCLATRAASVKGNPKPKTAFTDAKLEEAFRRLSTDKTYSLQTGIDYVEMNVRNIRTLKLGCDENTNSDLLWHLVKLTHSADFHAVEKLVTDMRTDKKTPDSWRAISDYLNVKANRDKLRLQTGYDFVPRMKNVDDVFANGNQLMSH